MHSISTGATSAPAGSSRAVTTPAWSAKKPTSSPATAISSSIRCGPAWSPIPATTAGPATRPTPWAPKTRGSRPMRSTWPAPAPPSSAGTTTASSSTRPCPTTLWRRSASRLAAATPTAARPGGTGWQGRTVGDCSPPSSSRNNHKARHMAGIRSFLKGTTPKQPLSKEPPVRREGFAGERHLVGRGMQGIEEVVDVVRHDRGGHAQKERLARRQPVVPDAPGGVQILAPVRTQVDRGSPLHLPGGKRCAKQREGFRELVRGSLKVDKDLQQAQGRRVAEVDDRSTLVVPAPWHHHPADTREILELRNPPETRFAHATYP